MRDDKTLEFNSSITLVIVSLSCLTRQLLEPQHIALKRANMHKKVIGLLLAMGVAASLAACGGGTTPAESPAMSPGESPAMSPAPTTTP